MLDAFLSCDNHTRSAHSNPHLHTHTHTLACARLQASLRLRWVRPSASSALRQPRPELVSVPVWRVMRVKMAGQSASANRPICPSSCAPVSHRYVRTHAKARIRVCVSVCVRERERVYVCACVYTHTHTHPCARAQMWPEYKQHNHS